MRFGIGQPVTRKEDGRFLTGQGRYVADIDLVRQSLRGLPVLAACPCADPLRSTSPRRSRCPVSTRCLPARTGRPTGSARLDPEAMPEDMGGPKGYRTKRPPLAQGPRALCRRARRRRDCRNRSDGARCGGAGRGRLRDIARRGDASKLRSVRVRRWSMTASANNTSFTMRMGNGDAVDAAFARAHHVTRLSLYNNRLTAVTMEPRGCIADYDPGTRRYTLYTSTQNVHGVRQTLAHHILHVPESRIRVVARDVGGGFGMKGNVYPEEAILVWAARRVGRPVKWIPTRSEALARRLCRARPERRRRIGARRRRQVPGLALDRLAQCRRLYRGRRRHPDHVFAKARLDRLRHPGGVGDEQPRLHQYRADRALSRRRPARGRLHHGAPRRSGGARDAASIRPNCAKGT